MKQDRKSKPEERQVPKPLEGRKQGKEDSVFTPSPARPPRDCQTSGTKRVSADYPGDVP